MKVIAEMLLTRLGTRRAFSTGMIRLNTQLHQIKDTPKMTWPEFFALRLRRRRIRLASAAVGAFVAANLAFAYVGNKEIDMDKTFMEVPMVYVYGGGIVMAGFGGYLAGPSVGDMVFRASLRSRAAAFAHADNVFLRHIARNRPNPAKVSATNPLTDYYGEKIGSIHDYRRWLREARLFQRRAEKFV